MQRRESTKAADPLATTRDREVRAQILRSLPQGFFKKSPGRLIYVALAWLCLGLHFYVTAFYLDGRAGLLLYLLTLCAAVLTYPCFLFTLHEISHGAVIGSKRAGRLLGAAAGFWILFQPRFWFETHSHHHAHTNMQADNDRLRFSGGSEPGGRLMDFRLTNPVGLFSALFSVQMNYFVLMFGCLMGQVNYPLSRRRMLADLLMNVAGVLIVFYLIEWRVALAGFLPTFVLGSILQNLFIITNHRTRPMSTQHDSLGTTTSVHFFGVSPMGFGRHVEHHLFPNVSHGKLRHVTRALRTCYPQQFNEAPLLRAVVRVFSLPGYYYSMHVLSDRLGRRKVTIN